MAFDAPMLQCPNFTHLSLPRSPVSWFGGRLAHLMGPSHSVQRSELPASWTGAGQIDFMWPRLALLSPALPPAKSSEEEQAKYLCITTIPVENSLIEEPRRIQNSPIVIIAHQHHEPGEWRWREPLLQNILLWTRARLFDWLLTPLSCWW